MTEIMFKSKYSNEWNWACNVVDQKAQQFVDKKNRMFDHGEWKVGE